GLLDRGLCPRHVPARLRLGPLIVGRTDQECHVVATGASLINQLFCAPRAARLSSAKPISSTYRRFASPIGTGSPASSPPGRSCSNRFPRPAAPVALAPEHRRLLTVVAGHFDH